MLVKLNYAFVSLRRPLPLAIPVVDDGIFAPIWARSQSAQVVFAFHRWLVLALSGSLHGCEPPAVRTMQNKLWPNRQGRWRPCLVGPCQRGLHIIFRDTDSLAVHLHESPSVPDHNSTSFAADVGIKASTNSVSIRV